jgi:hypothetical protein
LKSNHTTTSCKEFFHGFGLCIKTNVFNSLKQGEKPVIFVVQKLQIG